jgi:phytoene dehydrogenase-like protein
MADASYDAVMIGGGHNALVTALYLAKNGMKVGVFERLHEIGGEFCSEELPLPGFLMNTCATFIRFYLCPAVYDFNLHQCGLDLVMPEPSQSFIYDDETALVIWSTQRVDLETGKVTDNPEGLERNLKGIAGFSQRDAETCAEWAERFRGGMSERIGQWLYNPPPPPGEKYVEDELIESGEVDPRWREMTIGEVAYDIFESDAMRVYFMRLAQGHIGSYPHAGQPVMFHLHQLGSMAGGMPISVAIGGTHSIAHALQRALSSLGGQFFVSSEVDKILVENGKAKGVRLVDGSEIEARRLVVSGVDPDQLVSRFLAPELTSNDIKRKVKNLFADNYGVIWTTFALHELPKYKAENYDPNCMTQRCYFGPKDADYLRFKKLAESHRYGLPSHFFFHLTHDTAFAPGYAPPGKHLCLVEDYTAEDGAFTEKEWEGIRRKVPQALLKQWQQYAPNMTPDNIIGAHVILGPDLRKRFTWGCWCGINHLPSQMGRFRPIPEWARYRTHIKNLYLCGQTQHPGASSWGLPGYNCYKIISEDLGLRKVWEEKGRPY